MALKFKQNILFFAVSCAISPLAFSIEPASIPVGELQFTPTVKLTTGHEDNILSTNNNEKSSMISKIAPNFVLGGETEKTKFAATYGFERGIYHSSSQDSYLDHNLNFNMDIIGNSRNRINLTTGYSKGHEPRGQESGGSTQLNNDKPLEFNLKSVGASYTYGGDSAKGQVTLRTAYEDKDYTNFSTITDSKDYDKVTVGADFNYRMTAKTSALIEVDHNSVDYDTAARDNKNIKVLTGVTWDATAKTSGTLKVGWSEKDFDDSALKDTSGGTWDVSVSWNPKTYSTFTFTTNQDFAEATTADSTIDSETYGLKWEHYWKDNFKTNLGYSNKSEEYNVTKRSDDTETITIGMSHDTRRWLSLGASYVITDKTSSVSTNAYKNNAIMFTIDASL